MVCISSGAPDKPKDKQLQEFWDVLRTHNAVFYGDPGLQAAIDAYLTSHNIRRPGTTPKQTEYIKHLKGKAKKQPETAVI